MTMVDTDNLMTASDAAAHAGIGRSTLTTYVTRGHGPKVTRVAGHTFFLRADVDAWLAKRPGRGARTDLEPSAHP